MVSAVSGLAGFVTASARVYPLVHPRQQDAQPAPPPGDSPLSRSSFRAAPLPVSFTGGHNPTSARLTGCLRDVPACSSPPDFGQNSTRAMRSAVRSQENRHDHSRHASAIACCRLCFGQFFERVSEGAAQAVAGSQQPPGYSMANRIPQPGNLGMRMLASQACSPPVP